PLGRSSHNLSPGIVEIRAFIDQFKLREDEGRIPPLIEVVLPLAARHSFDRRQDPTRWLFADLLVEVLGDRPNMIGEALQGRTILGVVNDEAILVIVIMRFLPPLPPYETLHAGSLGCRPNVPEMSSDIFETV